MPSINAGNRGQASVAYRAESRGTPRFGANARGSPRPGMVTVATVARSLAIERFFTVPDASRARPRLDSQVAIRKPGVEMLVPHLSRRGFTGLIALAALVGTRPVGAQANPSWQGRPFVKVLAKGDPIPGTAGARFNAIERFTLRDGKLHIVAGEGATKQGLFRWQNGTLTKLIYTDTLAPTGSTFDTVHFSTDETEGALNFAAEVSFNRPGAINGFFEWRAGVITTVFDGQRSVAGKILNGLGYPVRVGHEVAGGTLFTENGTVKNGIFRWDGTTLRTVIQTGDELPGSLGGFTGQPGRYQIAFDGQNVGFVASADPQGKGPFGMYRTGPDGSLIKLIDGNDKHPSQNGSKTYFQRGAPFVNLDLDGPNSFLGVYEMVSAAGSGNSFYGLGVRFSGGTIDVAKARFGDDGTSEVLLPYPDGITPPKLDGKTLTGLTQVDGQGDDVAVLVTLEGGLQAIYAAIGATTPPPAAPILTVPTVTNGRVTIRFASSAGRSYRLEFQAPLGDASWTSRGNLAGTGAELEFTETAATAGFYRVAVVP